MARIARSRAARLGRRVGIAVFSLFVAIPTAAWSIQIMQVVWAPPPGTAPETCREGLRSLLDAVARARAPGELEHRSERATMERFRAALLPEWSFRGGLNGLCRTAEEAAMLKTIDGLRYAEEHAVRYEATALLAQRAAATALSTKLREPEKQSP